MVRFASLDCSLGGRWLLFPGLLCMDGLVSDCGGEAESATGTGIVPVPETDLPERGGSFAGCLRVGSRCALRSISLGRRVESGVV